MADDGEYVKARFSYSAESADELNLSRGQILKVLHECDDGWWEVWLSKSKICMP